MRKKLMNWIDITDLEEKEAGEITVRVKVKEEHEKVTGPSFSFYIEEKEILISVHSAVFYAYTRVAYLVFQAFMDSGMSFRMETL